MRFKSIVFICTTQHLSSSSSSSSFLFFSFGMNQKQHTKRKQKRRCIHDVNSPWKMPMQINLSQAVPVRHSRSIKQARHSKSDQTFSKMENHSEIETNELLFLFQSIVFFSSSIIICTLNTLTAERSRHNNKKRETTKRSLSIHIAQRLERVATTTEQLTTLH